ncbi:hypothetical protein HDU86_000930 [Geranomyces michiganensis]|nr:hypothetical protein HDU86_000930 [Geranomyces michiganensis]
MIDVLNLRLASIERWTWETDAVPLDMRRQINGKFRVYMHEEITQALLIHHVGKVISSGKHTGPHDKSSRHIVLGKGVMYVAYLPTDSAPV